MEKNKWKNKAQNKIFSRNNPIENKKYLAKKPK